MVQRKMTLHNRDNWFYSEVERFYLEVENDFPKILK